MIRVLFVCHGNICRSAMAKYMFKDMVKKNNIAHEFEIDLCGTSDEEAGNDIYYLAARCLDRHHIPYDHHVARKIKKKDFDYYDKIIAMDSYNIRNLKRFCDSEKIVKLLAKDVADPWYTNDFETCYNDIQKGLLILLKEYEDAKRIED